jgi:hypothetical protein
MLLIKESGYVSESFAVLYPSFARSSERRISEGLTDMYYDNQDQLVKVRWIKHSSRVRAPRTAETRGWYAAPRAMLEVLDLLVHGSE